MKIADHCAVAVLFLLGCVHNFVAAPVSFQALDTRALWFVTGGIVLWYAAIINWLWFQRERQGRLAWFGLMFANLALIGFAVLFMAVRRSWSEPQNLALLAPAVWLSVRGLFAMRRGDR